MINGLTKITDMQLYGHILLWAKALVQPQEINLLNSSVKAKYTPCMLESPLSHMNFTRLF